MPRPVKIRRVESVPGVTYFKPAGIPLRYLEETLLSVEEAEALRLKDMEKLEQEKCAERMSVSRATFQRILTSARQKITGALLSGKAIRIEGGTFEMAQKLCTCRNGHEWVASFEEITGDIPIVCPECEAEVNESAALE
ncbi:MAG: DUF134 domain-containing protein [Dehalococcoidales bacterium]|nr:DUF134 domain-containing protein [Dehalococcoidales bacterium]